MDTFMHRKDDGQAPQQQHQYSERNQLVDGDNGRVGEKVPRAHGTEPDEDGDVEQHVDGGLEGVVHRFEAEPVVPCEGVAGDEAGEYVI
jgi:hypothetical protein